MNVDLVEKALMSAIYRRNPKGGIIHHSDRGSQYTSSSFKQLCELHSIKLLMSEGSCSDVAYKPSEKEKLADSILEKAALKLKKDKDLCPCGSDGGVLHEIKMLALSFDYYKPINIEQARILVVECVNEFIDVVNQDEQIRPYLYNYPFEPKNIEIRIFIRNPDGSSITLGDLSVVVSINGGLKYYINDPKTTRLKTLHKETFEEALERIKASEKN